MAVNTVLLRQGVSAVGAIKDSALEKSSQQVQLATKFGDMSVEDLGKIQALGGTTQKESQKLQVINAAVWGAELGQIDEASKELGYCHQLYYSATKLAILDQYTAPNGRIHWDEVSKAAAAVKDAKLMQAGALSKGG